jgi:hydroxymethylglutaryl-CoA lyase
MFQIRERIRWGGVSDMNYPTNITINEVGLRDGLQLEEKILSTKDKSMLIDYLEDANVSVIEFGSFVHPKAVPQMANSRDLFIDIGSKEHLNLVALIPNQKGAEIAADIGVKEINYVFSASNTHNEQNVRKTTEESLKDFKQIKAFCENNNIKINVTLATSFGCPFEGDISEQRVFSITEILIEGGVNTLTYADTTGMANPYQVFNLASEAKKRYPVQDFGLHFHNTRGMGLSNVLAGMQAGIDRFDAALGGIGGCPFAPGATGNVCTEDVVHMMEEMNISTNINLDGLIEASRLLQKLLGHELPGQVLKSGKSSRRYPVPQQFKA